jgi:adenine phosphoribosyltransferase
VAGLTDDLAARIPWVGGHADVWRAFSDPGVFARLVAALSAPCREDGVTKVAGIEARGFILGGAVAAALGAGFVAVRKEQGLFPGPKLARTAGPDYRGNRCLLRLQRASVEPGDRVVLVDDWAETGSQALAARLLLEEAGAVWAGASLVVDQLTEDARARLAPVHALLLADQLGPDDGSGA